MPESFPVTGCWPQFEYVVFISNETLVVGDEFGKTRRHAPYFMLFADILNRIQQQLQCRQPLLAVYDFASLHVPGCSIHLLNYDGA